MRTLETTEMDNDEARDWAERIIRQVRERTKSLCLRRNSPFITSELIFNTEQTKFLIQACYKHKIGVYINTDPNTDEYYRNDLVALEF